MLTRTSNIVTKSRTLAWRAALPCWGGGVAEEEVSDVVGSPVVPEPVNCEVG